MPSVTAVIDISIALITYKITRLYLLIFIDYFLISDHIILAMSNFEKNEWRAIIHFLQKEGLSPTEAAKKLKLHYGILLLTDQLLVVG